MPSDTARQCRLFLPNLAVSTGFVGCGRSGALGRSGPGADWVEDARFAPLCRAREAYGLRMPRRSQIGKGALVGVVAALAIALVVARPRGRVEAPLVTSVAPSSASAPPSGSIAPIGERQVDPAAHVHTEATSGPAEPSVGARDDGAPDVVFVGPPLLSAAPWFVDATFVSSGTGPCGAEEGTLVRRLRFEAGGAPLVRALPSQPVTCGGPGYEKPIAFTPRTFDFDGDAVPELLLAFETERRGRTFSDDGVAYTVKNGVIVPFRGETDGGAATVPETFADIDDIDGDGRPDLLTSAGYRDVDLLCGAHEASLEPIFAYHAKRDGTFSARDFAARRALYGACARTTLEDAVTTGLCVPLAIQIVCERTFGKSADVLEKRLRKACPSFEDGRAPRDEEGGSTPPCPAWTLELARRPPPFHD